MCRLFRYSAPSPKDLSNFSLQLKNTINVNKHVKHAAQVAPKLFDSDDVHKFIRQNAKVARLIILRRFRSYIRSRARLRVFYHLLPIDLFGFSIPQFPRELTAKLFVRRQLLLESILYETIIVKV